MVVSGENGQRVAIDLSAVNAVVEGPRGTHRLHLRGDKEGFPIVGDFFEIVRLVDRAKRNVAGS